MAAAAAAAADAKGIEREKRGARGQNSKIKVTRSENAVEWFFFQHFFLFLKSNSACDGFSFPPFLDARSFISFYFYFFFLAASFTIYSKM